MATTDPVTKELFKRIAELCHRIPPELIGSICARLDQASMGTRLDVLAGGLAGIPEASFRAEFADIAVKWIEVHGADSLDQLAIALSAAAATESAARSRQDLELIWTGPRNHRSVFRRTDQALFEVIDRALEELWVVCYASYKAREVGRALARAHARGVSIKLIVESKEDSEGALRFSAVDALGIDESEVTSIYHWPRDKRPTDDSGKPAVLHAKCALADANLLFVSSANLTGSALERNMEMGVLIRGTSLPRQAALHFTWLVESGELRELINK